MWKTIMTALSILAMACGQAVGAPLVGGDSDKHGCKASAGYRWCAKTAQCERPWEIAKAKGFENTAEAFEAYCGE